MSNDEGKMDDFTSVVHQEVQNELKKIFKSPDILLSFLIKQTETVIEQTGTIQKQTGTIKEQTEIIQEQKETMLEMKPKAEFYDAVTESDDWFEMSAAVKLLSMKGFGRNKVFDILRRQKILRPDAHNEPYQEYIDRGYFRTIMEKWEFRGETKIYRKTLVSAKGVDYIYKILKEINEVYEDINESIKRGDIAPYSKEDNDY